MITLIIFTLVGLIIGALSIYDSWGMNFIDWVMLVFTSAFSGVLGFIVGILFALSLPAQMIETENARVELLCLQDNQSVQGRFFLGSGYMEGKPCYNFYQANERGGKVLVQVQADKVEVYDNLETGKPYCIEYKTKPTDAFVNNFAIDETKTRYEIYVPKGTIKENFKLDAQ